MGKLKSTSNMMTSKTLILGILIGSCTSFPQKLATTTTPPPQPFKYVFSAARLPGAAPDRYVESEGVIRGSYAYLDPNQEWRQVQYVADQDGFHVDPSVLPVASPVSHPHDTAAVSQAKLQHQELYDAIALRNSQVPVAIQRPRLAESPAVARVRSEFASQFERISAEHARIAAEHEALAIEEERQRQEAALAQS